MTDRRQRVILPGAESAWKFIRAGVPQAYIQGPVRFLLFINDIVTAILCNIGPFADDTSWFIIGENPDTAAELLNLDPEQKLGLSLLFSRKQSLFLSLVNLINLYIHNSLWTIQL